MIRCSYLILLHLQGTMKLGRLAKSLAVGVNVKRIAKGLLPRPVICFAIFISFQLLPCFDFQLH